MNGEDRMSAFVCPVCRDELMVCGKSYVCGKGHSFDIAAKGYVNLLLSSQMNAKLPGDNKMMVNARTDFLGKGYYSHLAEEMCRAAGEYFESGILLDAGCGEGYYSEKIYNSLREQGKEPHLACMDISKFACAAAARRFKGNADCETAAASIFHIPMADSTADMIVTMFAPMCRDELYRVLKKDGIMIMAIPGEEHLMSLKSAVYDEPYKNQTADYAIEGFEFIGSRKCSRNIHIDNGSDIASLFSMTPYYYKTGVEGHERVKRLTELDTMADFEILIYRRQAGKTRCNTLC